MTVTRLERHSPAPAARDDKWMPTRAGILNVWRYYDEVFTSTIYETEHPVVRVHAETGRKGLYISEQVRCFVGMTAAESKPLRDFLVAHATRPQFVYRHQWQRDDLVMWDNRCLLHAALDDYDRTQVRHMERTTVNAEKSGYVYDGPIE